MIGNRPVAWSWGGGENMSRLKNKKKAPKKGVQMTCHYQDNAQDKVELEKLG